MAAFAAATAVFAAAPGVASAHSLASSSVTIELGADDMTGSISLAVASLDEAFDTDHGSSVLSAEEYAAQVVAYLDDHLTVSGADGSVWPEQYSNLVRQTVEGIETISVDVSFDLQGDDPAHFTIAYDAIIDAVHDHSAVLVFVDATNRASTPGVFTAADGSITIGDGQAAAGALDMVRHGFHHVLDGADHLLFLLALLLPAPLVASAGRWRRGPGLGASVRRVTHVVTAFTAGHSLTLAATALGWISVPSRPVEVLVAVSVAVSAVHAIRPIARRGEPVIAATFGLVHGMAFAGILTELGLSRSTSLVPLLAFNVGIELAQLAAIACVFPSLFLMSTCRGYPAVRVAGATLALLAAGGWLVDRTGVAADPFESVGTALVEHPWTVVAAIAAIAVAVRMLDRRAIGSGDRDEVSAPLPVADADALEPQLA